MRVRCLFFSVILWFGFALLAASMQLWDDWGFNQSDLDQRVLGKRIFRRSQILGSDSEPRSITSS